MKSLASFVVAGLCAGVYVVALSQVPAYVFLGASVACIAVVAFGLGLTRP